VKKSFLALLLWVALAAPASAATPTVEELVRQPSLAGVTLSRSGRYFAATVPVKGRMNLAVIDLEGGTATTLTSFEDFDVINASWVGDDWLVFSLGQANSPTGPGEFDGGGLIVTSRDGKEFRRISPTVREMRRSNQFVPRGLHLFRTLPDNNEEVIAEGNMTDAESLDLYRLNLHTGRYTLLTQGRPARHTADWILDSKMVPRVVTAWEKDTLTFVVYYRKDESSEWAEIARFDRNKGPTFVPLAFESDDRTLQVAFNGGRDTMAIFRYDPAGKKMGDMIAQHPRYDMGADASGDALSGVIMDWKTDRILGYGVDGAKPEVVWIDEKYDALQKSLDAAFPGHVNSFRRTPDGKRLLVRSYSDTSPPRWYLFDEEKRTLERVGAARPWLDGKLVEQRPFFYKTRDGLEIGGYYFLPADYKPGTRLPTIVHIHGGPSVRADYWGSGFGVLEGQLFASRGYAVIVPNFRITPGFGGKIYYSGFGAVGKQMSDDHEDALKWGIAQGFVDPDRVCISGASYGGYATLQALSRSSMWKCGVAGLAVTDWEYQVTTYDGDTAPNEAAVALWKSILGSKDLGSPEVRAISPVYYADRIKQPVFLYAGETDIRVPLTQIKRMNDNLTKAGNAPKEFLIKEREGHGFGRVENNVDLYEKVLKFLDKQIGAGRTL
jgi:dipeptidyl aminopeptidase/acylaminoacyl peptidase